MPKSITDPTYVGSKAYINYIKLLKKKMVRKLLKELNTKKLVVD